VTARRRPIFGEQQRFMVFLIAPAALLLLLFQVVPIAIGANARFRDWALYKSTTLRMIAGLEDISGGEIHIGDRVSYRGNCPCPPAEGTLKRETS